MIDALQNLFSDINTTNELFLTWLGSFQNIESANIINALADNAFKYQITSADTTILYVNPTPYSFTISINIQYNDSEFKGLLIDLVAAI